MPNIYLHYFGNESSDSILEAYGLKPKQEEIDKMQPVQCPNCGEGNRIDSKFCAKCRMVLSYDAYSETVEEKQQDTDALATLSDQIVKLTERLKEREEKDRELDEIRKSIRKLQIELGLRALNYLYIDL